MSKLLEDLIVPNTLTGLLTYPVRGWKHASSMVIEQLIQSSPLPRKGTNEKWMETAVVRFCQIAEAALLYLALR